MRIGEVLKPRRETLQLTVTQVAKQMAAPEHLILAWENGLTLPTLAQVLELATIYQLPLAQLTTSETDFTQHINELENLQTTNVLYHLGPLIANCVLLIVLTISLLTNVGTNHLLGAIFVLALLAIFVTGQLLRPAWLRNWKS